MAKVMGFHQQINFYDCRYFTEDIKGMIAQIDLCNRRILQMAEKIDEKSYKEAVAFMSIVENEQNVLQDKWYKLQEKILAQ